MGNLTCGCSDIIRDKTIPDEEVIEFQSDLFPHPTTNPVLVLPEPLAIQPPPPESLEGELFRYHKTSKEILVPRWCKLSENSFRYYKSHYSSLCNEKPLFEISVDKLSCSKFYKSSGKLFMEISYSKTSSGPSSNCSVSSYSSRPSLLGSKHGKTPSNLSLCEESILFVIKSKSDWENWKKVFPDNSKIILTNF
jgi:hypothetical protein